MKFRGTFFCGARFCRSIKYLFSKEIDWRPAANSLIDTGDTLSATIFRSAVPRLIAGEFMGFRTLLQSINALFYIANIDIFCNIRKSCRMVSHCREATSWDLTARLTPVALRLQRFWTMPRLVASGGESWGSDHFYGSRFSFVRSISGRAPRLRRPFRPTPPRGRYSKKLS
jgi:hypothetical protein